MPSVTNSAMEKEHKKRRRKGEEGEGEVQPKKKKSKHKHDVAADITDGGRKPQLSGPGTAQPPMTVQQNGKHSHTQQFRNEDTPATLNVNGSQLGRSGTATSQRPIQPSAQNQEKPHKKKKKRREHPGSEDGDAIARSPPLSQDQGGQQKKERKHKHKVGTDEPQLQGNNTATSPQPPPPTTSEWEKTRSKKNKLDYSDNGNGDASINALPTAPVSQKTDRPRKKGEKDKDEVTTVIANEPILQEGNLATNSRVPVPISQDHARPSKREKERKHVIADIDTDQPQMPNSGTVITSGPPEYASQTQQSPPKKMKHKRLANEDIADKPSIQQNGVARLPDPSSSISQHEVPPRKKKKKKEHRHAATNLDADESGLQNSEMDPPTQHVYPSKRLPKPDPNSPTGSSFHLQTSSLYLPLAPISQLHPLEGLCAEHLSPLILNYYTPFRGVVLSYHNPRLSNSPQTSADQESDATPFAKSIDEYAAPFVWVTADFLIFRPQVGTLIEGWVNLQNEGHIGLVCWNLFNASIGRNRIPAGWKWVQRGWDVGVKGWKGNSKKGKNMFQDEELDDAEVDSEAAEEENLGHFEDETGQKIEGALTFRVKRVEVSRTWDREKGEKSFVSLEGSLLTQEQEEELKEKAEQKKRAGVGNEVRARRGYEEYTMSDALRDGRGG